MAESAWNPLVCLFTRDFKQRHEIHTKRILSLARLPIPPRRLLSDGTIGPMLSRFGGTQYGRRNGIHQAVSFEAEWDSRKRKSIGLRLARLPRADGRGSARAIPRRDGTEAEHRDHPGLFWQR